MLRFTPPATATIDFDDSGSYSVFLESDSAPTSFITGPAIEVVSVDSAQSATVAPFIGSLTYNVNDVSGDGFATIRIPEAGTYEVRVGPLDAPGQVAIDYQSQMGFRFLGFAIGGIFLAIFGGIFWAVVFFVILIVRIVRTSREQRQAQQPAGWQQGAYAQPYPPSGYYPQQPYPQPAPQQGDPQPTTPAPAPAAPEQSYSVPTGEETGGPSGVDRTPPDKDNSPSS